MKKNSPEESKREMKEENMAKNEEGKKIKNGAWKQNQEEISDCRRCRRK